MTCECRKGATCAEHLAEADLTLRSRHIVEPSPDACLCCICGAVSLEREWTYWQYWQRTDEDGWRPSLMGEGDPMMRCPVCKWEHTDTEDGSGVYMGTLVEMEAQREADLPEFGEWWAERQEEIAA